MAKSLFDKVEVMVFSELDDRPLSISKVHIMQAAYIVCLYQNWDGDEKAKRRIRRERFSALVSVARDIEIRNARHGSFDWHAFALHEQLIRLLLWIFLLDTAFVIFNNHPPRMVVREMVMDLATNEAAFQAQTAEECRSFLTPSATLFESIQQICLEFLDVNQISQLASIGPLNLFAITSSLHSMLFYHQNGFNTVDQLQPIRQALDNWKVVWSRYLQDHKLIQLHDPLNSKILTTENMWRRVGFRRFASEYWLLASLILDRMCLSDRTLQPIL